MREHVAEIIRFICNWLHCVKRETSDGNGHRNINNIIFDIDFRIFSFVHLLWLAAERNTLWAGADYSDRELSVEIRTTNDFYWQSTHTITKSHQTIRKNKHIFITITLYPSHSRLHLCVLFDEVDPESEKKFRLQPIAWQCYIASSLRYFNGSKCSCFYYYSAQCQFPKH